MSLYNLHYLEFMATSHDKFLSHPADITQRIFAPSRIGYPHAQKFHGTRLLLVIQKERPVRQSAHPMIAPAMLEDPRLPHGRRHTISTSSVSMSSCVFWSHGDGGNHSPSAGEISPFILADCRWSRTAGRLASGLPSGGGVTGRLSSAGTVLCTSILGGNVQDASVYVLFAVAICISVPNGFVLFACESPGQRQPENIDRFRAVWRGGFFRHLFHERGR